mmetsp:Transcript_33675/g.32143  ORF Transcript_33675/g.32143 Transcript_33675/m.32143 type:complete len:464 (+) Transcript_33675:141-1532(+)
MSQCARPDCIISGNSFCSNCHKECYCSSNCQKLDWKAHKPLCIVLKKLSKELQPYRETVQLIEEILASKKGENIRILEHLLLYADFQFGPRATVNHRERNNWVVEINVMYDIHSRLIDIYKSDKSLKFVTRDDKTFPHIEKSLFLLNLWIVNLDSDGSNGVESLDDDDINYLLNVLFITEQSMATITMNRNQFDIADGHCQRSLKYAKRFGIEGEGKIDLIFSALTTYIELRKRQCDKVGAVTLAEEAYNLLVVAYDCVHPKVQEAAGVLINCLINSNDSYNAERYAEVTYSNLRDKKNGIDQEGDLVAEGSTNLAEAIIRQHGDLIRAEGLARDALRIRMQVHGSDHNLIGFSLIQVARVLILQNKFGNETKELFERSLAIFMGNEGPNGANTAMGMRHMALYYVEFAEIQTTTDTKRTHYLLAKSYLEEIIHVWRSYGPTHPMTIKMKSLLELVLAEIDDC